MGGAIISAAAPMDEGKSDGITGYQRSLLEYTQSILNPIDAHRNDDVGSSVIGGGGGGNNNSSL
jgi:hypothetical protein